ncbi:MAG TPA: SMC-Scp complex subunit ScpB [Candidatus Nanoarchaeia archaeon]|nr:SMC-Scp complex subunit ScpB [Candidatus Nanoarchaeia archaeon]
MKDEAELKQRIEAILFAAGKRISLDEICRLLRTGDQEKVKTSLNELKHDYDERQSPMMVVEEGIFWKLTVREKHLSLVKEIVPEAEMPKTVMETLSVIAWKSPALQSEIIELRTNKAYDHIDELESLGFIVKEKHGRSYLLRLTQKFFDYFDLKDEEEVRKKFEKFKERALKKMEERSNAPAQVPQVQQQDAIPKPEGQHP